MLISDNAMVTIRYILIAVGSFMAGKGWVSMAWVNSFVDQLPAIAGAAVSLGTAIWGLYVRWGTTSVPAITAARVDVPTINPVTGATIPGNATAK